MEGSAFATAEAKMTVVYGAVVVMMALQRPFPRVHNARAPPRSPTPLLVAASGASSSSSLHTGPSMKPMAVVEAQLKALQSDEVGSCFNLSSADLRHAAGPKPRFTDLLRTMPEYKPMIASESYEVLSALQVGTDTWKYRVRVANKLGSIPFSVGYTYELTKGECDVRHDLGQCITHRKHKDMPRGVIAGWDSRCRQPETWCRANDVDSLPMGRDQPFYHVLVDNNRYAYVAQEHVECTGVEPITHKSFDEYFSGEVTDEADEARRTYVPTREAREQYPLGLEGCWLVNRVFPDKEQSSFDA